MSQFRRSVLDWTSQSTSSKTGLMTTFSPGSEVKSYVRAEVLSIGLSFARNSNRLPNLSPSGSAVSPTISGLRSSSSVKNS